MLANMSKVTWFFSLFPFALALVDSQGLLGWKKVDTGSAEIVDLANRVLQMYDDTMDYTAKLSKILDGYVQVGV